MSERTRERLAGRAGTAALIVRTDYGDDRAWAALLAALARPWGPGDFEPKLHIVDDPAWAGAAPGEVLAATAGDEDLRVVFLADTAAMRGGDLLAVAALSRADCESDEEYAAWGGEFRTLPGGVHEIRANLMIANLDFADFAEAAREQPDGVFRAL